jgi:enoyl-CoA hydratase/carnithine racemase
VNQDVAGTDGSIAVSGRTVRTVELCRPDSRNALDAQLYAALADALDAIAADPQVRAVIVTGRGRAFSAGGDFELIRAMQGNRRLRDQTLELARRLFDRFITLEVPVIGAVNGPAVGAGCTLAMLCDVVVMAEDAYLADPHVEIGLVPGDGGTVLWPLLAGLPAARAYLLTGDRLSATEAHRLGLVHDVVPLDRLEGAARSFADKIAARPSFAVRETKRVLNLHLANAALISFDAALGAESRSFDSDEHHDRTTRGPGAVGEKPPK